MAADHGNVEQPMRTMDVEAPTRVRNMGLHALKCRFGQDLTRTGSEIQFPGWGLCSAGTTYGKHRGTVKAKGQTYRLRRLRNRRALLLDFVALIVPCSQLAPQRSEYWGEWYICYLHRDDVMKPKCNLCAVGVIQAHIASSRMRS
jgi:hypothetical protein